MIYYLNNPEHCAKLRQLANEGGHSVEVAESEYAQPLRLENLRLNWYGKSVTGDARVVMPEDAATH